MVHEQSSRQNGTDSGLRGQPCNFWFFATTMRLSGWAGIVIGGWIEWTKGRQRVARTYSSVPARKKLSRTSNPASATI